MNDVLRELNVGERDIYCCKGKENYRKALPSGKCLESKNPSNMFGKPTCDDVSSQPASNMFDQKVIEPISNLYL